MACADATREQRRDRASGSGRTRERKIFEYVRAMGLRRTAFP
jgi:hypothetical protein